jgi:hypothetical protein
VKFYVAVLKILFISIEVLHQNNAFFVLSHIFFGVKSYILSCNDQDIVTCISGCVTIDRVWIGEWIY